MKLRDACADYLNFLRHEQEAMPVRRYAEAIRAAAVAYWEMETERNGPQCDGLAEILEDFAEGAELEVFGPKGLREG